MRGVGGAVNEGEGLGRNNVSTTVSKEGKNSKLKLEKGNCCKCALKSVVSIHLAMK